MATAPQDRIRSRIEESVERGDVYALDCPSRSLLDHVTSRWGVLVLVLLAAGPHRFSELSRLIPDVSDKMLSQTLKTLTSDGFIERVVDDGPPVRVAYELTALGGGVASRLADLVDWLELNAAAVLAAR